MNCSKRIHYGNKSFLRSWLESSPAGVEPKPFSTFKTTRPSDRTHSQLHRLKRKLLRAALEETPETGTFKQLCGAANQAADLAWATSHPLLVFPHLFDEMVTAARDRFQQEQISDAQPSLTSLDADLRFEAFIPSPAGLISFQPGRVSGRLTKTQLVATAPPARRRGCHTSNEANHAIQPT